MSSLTLRSPAKLNLYLQVVRKRKDGYHELKTIFERISLFDRIRLTSNSTGKIKICCNHPHVPVGPKNLCYKVACLLQNHCKTSKGVTIDIQKNIPVAAGLGGGSSNAATLLMGLNRLWRLGLNRTQLVALGKKIGSDVPFFLYDCSWALGTGRGDLIKRLNLKAKLWHILVVPKLKLYSYKVYGGLNLRLTKKKDDVNILRSHLKTSNIIGVGRCLRNDLESSILELSPQLAGLKKRLKLLNTQGVMISGSGPAVFGLTSSPKLAEDLLEILKRRHSQVFAVRTL